jgi:phosphate transport system protein
MSEHIFKQFDTELERMRSRVLVMADLVKTQVKSAIQALAEGSLAMIELVLKQEEAVNALHLELDEFCVHLIARRQPAATDLRMILSVIKAVEDLERIGDKAVRICMRTRSQLKTGTMAVPQFAELRHIADYAMLMLQDVLDAFMHLDAVAAAKVRRDDTRLDDEYRALQRQLITIMMEDPRNITYALDVLWNAKAIERIGDHVTNIAEQIIFMVKGKNIRHATIEEGEIAAKDNVA